jgi:hypothetical protein
VVTADGETLGVVADVGAVSFKVDVSMGPDFWLGRDYVVDASPAVVRMSFARRELNGYKLGQPGLSPEKDLTQESLVDTAVPEERQFEQRLRMEQELATQRQELPHKHPQGEAAPPDTGGTLGQPVESELAALGIDPTSAESADEAYGILPPEGDELTSEGQLLPKENPVGYSIPTRGETRDPAAMRKPALGGAVGLIVAGLVAGVAIVLLMRRRRARRPDARMKDAVRRAADIVRDAGHRGAESARAAITPHDA